MPTPYTLGIDQLHNQGIREDFLITPDNKLAQGDNSVGRFQPASYLPLQRFEDVKREYVVISSEKPVAFAQGVIVPAGYKLEADAYAVALATSVAAADAQATIRYTQLDVQQGVRNAKGVLVVANEPVVKSFFTGTTQDIKVSYVIGIANGNYFRQAGGTGSNPTQYRQYNFNARSTVSYNMDYHYEFPLVEDNTAYAAAPLAGVAAFIGTGIEAGMFITYDKQSNYVVADTDFSYGSTPVEAIIGQVSKVAILKDVVTGDVTANFNDISKVITPQNTSGNVLNELPGVATTGLTQKVNYANAYGLIQFGFQTR
jgi:hypothetical protein